MRSVRRRLLRSPSRRSRRAWVAAWASGRGPADRPPGQRVGRMNALRILEGISCAECAVVPGCMVLKRAHAFGCGTHHVLTPRPGVGAGRSALPEQSRVLSTGGFAAHGGRGCRASSLRAAWYSDEDQPPLPQRLERCNSVLSHARRPKITIWWRAWPSMPRLPCRSPC